MRRLAALAALLLPLALTTPARAACTDPDATGDLETRIAECQNELDQIYERSAQRHLVFNLARAYRLIDAPEMALALLNEVIGYDSGNALYWAELGRTLAALHEPGTALAATSEAIRLEPGNPWLLGERAALALQLGRSRDCLADLEAALPRLTLPEEQAWFQDLRGQCLLAGGDAAAALAAHEAAMALTPEKLTPQGNRLRALAALHRPADVVNGAGAILAAPGLAAAPESWILGIHALQAEAVLAQGGAAALPTLIIALEARHPDPSPEAAALIARLLLWSGQAGKAETAAAPLARHFADPGSFAYTVETDAQLLDVMAQVALAAGRTEDALQGFHDALWMDPLVSRGWIAPLIAQGYLPNRRTADGILLSLERCIRERGADCALVPPPPGSDAPITVARPAGPAEPGNLGIGAPIFAPGAAALETLPAAPAPQPAPAQPVPAPVEADAPALGTPPSGSTAPEGQPRNRP